MDQDCLIVIPARYNSQRFPGKVLAKIRGKAVLHWCYEAAVRSGLGPVVIATEDRRVLDFAKGIGAKAVMTSAKCQSGTDRVYEAAAGSKKKFIVNFQGDEPFMRSETLLAAFRMMKAGYDIGTAGAPITDKADIANPNCVKIAMNRQGRALYFSRSPIPFHHPLSTLRKFPWYKHCGFYIYRRASLDRFVKLPASPLELLERLEQLRALESGMTIGVAAVKVLGPAIDTPADLKAAERFLRKQN
ncbi:MAG: 3-deoxy-D-manno-octulosonate cytidylyltransferase [Elusimicrobia bacterium RIFOXYB2_FULL_62_6]|nr:MAG: 3-deoxy-D-manno-octulosonate cytidylyltransferase [Elusimicrobia bacterium RIFOXYB2_FULL_62_6]